MLYHVREPQRPNNGVSRCRVGDALQNKTEGIVLKGLEQEKGLEQLLRDIANMKVNSFTQEGAAATLATWPLSLTSATCSAAISSMRRSQHWAS